jgi:large subunit ribosomal protein L4
MNIALYSLKGEQIGTHEVSDVLYGAKGNPTLVFEVVNAYAANARQVLAHTKGKGDVAGGGKKPWKQKGTGLVVV